MTRSPVRAAVQVLRLADAVLVATVSSIAAYLGLLTAAAVHRHRRAPATCSHRSSRRFVVLVPAHDEEMTIAATLRSLRALHYDPTLVRVHVVADNCSDRTAAVVRSHGFAAHERHAPGDRGKGPALNWVRDEIDHAGEPYDAVAIVDADTWVDPHFLCAMDAALDGGAIAAQGCYGVRDPEASSTIAVRYAALACRHHLRPLGRSTLGMSCGLYGNGMVFTAEPTRHRRWSGHLVEDAEYQMELLLDGHIVHYVPAARVAAEMPAGTTAATTQNERWELGRLQLARRYVPQLLAAARERRHGRRVAYVDAVLDHLTPPLSVLVAAEAGVLVGSSLDLALSRGRRGRVTSVASLAAVAITSIHVLIGLLSVGAPRAVYTSLRAAPAMVIWKLRLWCRVLLRPDRVRWSRTERNERSPVA